MDAGLMEMAEEVLRAVQENDTVENRENLQTVNGAVLATMPEIDFRNIPAPECAAALGLFVRSIPFAEPNRYFREALWQIGTEARLSQHAQEQNLRHHGGLLYMYAGLMKGGYGVIMKGDLEMLASPEFDESTKQSPLFQALLKARTDLQEEIRTGHSTKNPNITKIFRKHLAAAVEANKLSIAGM